MAITKKQVLKTALLPGILPRLAELFGSGFSMLAYLIAVVYNTVRILPNNHPYLRQDQRGKYSIRQVIAEAANHISPTKKNIDQVIIFFSVIAALIILLIQFILLLIAMAIPKASAQTVMPSSIQEFFVTPNPKEDIAYRLLDLVFGVPDFFGSKEATDTALHQALRALFEFYSYGIILVGAMIIVYFVFAIVAETAQSGTPFGQRFNKVWAPIRVIVFFGLLIPISNGLNGGQYVTLASAKLGSSLASTGWILFNKKISEENSTPLGPKEQNVATPNYSDLSHLPEFMLIAKTCQKGYELIYNPIRPDNPTGFSTAWKPGDGETGVQAWAVYRNPNNRDGNRGAEFLSEKIGASTTFQNLTENSKGSPINIVFGVKAPEEFPNAAAGIDPVCGQLRMEVTDVAERGAAEIQTGYFNLIRDMWDGFREIDTYAENFNKRGLNIRGHRDANAPFPTEDYIKEWRQYLKEYMEEEGNGIIAKAVKAQIEQGKWNMPKEMQDYGWGGAGIWYNKIAQQNGALVSALRMTPVAVSYPRVMELVNQRKMQENENPDPVTKFTPGSRAGATDPGYKFPGESQIATTLSQVYVFWQLSEFKKDVKITGNKVIDAINLILGTGGLFEICKNTDIHPLAQLSALGKSMVDSSIRAIGLSGGLGFVSLFSGQFKASFAAASGFFSTIATIGLMIGFILFYVLPFLPFIYFFFAVGGWVKGIFEAMVAMPLWALAHLRIDGEGIPGDAAIGGYFLIFEIFIRPILIVVGLLAAISIFAGMIKILNEIFYLAISNLSGHDPKAGQACFTAPASTTGLDDEIQQMRAAELKDAYRGPVDEFFFTILYTIIVYMIGMSCFKLIDLIPNNILRWINAEVPSFNDNAGDAAEGLLTYVTLAGSQFGEQLGGSIKGMGGGARDSIQQFLGR